MTQPMPSPQYDKPIKDVYNRFWDTKSGKVVSFLGSLALGLGEVSAGAIIGLTGLAHGNLIFAVGGGTLAVKKESSNS